MKTHNFENSIVIGEKFEKLLDNYFSKYYTITEVSQEQQFAGIDRIFKNSDRELKIEYKCDTVTITSGNLFIETFSNVESGRKGWAFTSQADWIFYYLIGMDKIVSMKPENIRTYLKEWISKYRLQSVLNKDSTRQYHSRGILIPLEVFENSKDFRVSKIKL